MRLDLDRHGFHEPRSRMSKGRSLNLKSDHGQYTADRAAGHASDNTTDNSAIRFRYLSYFIGNCGQRPQPTIIQFANNLLPFTKAAGGGGGGGATRNVMNCCLP